MKYTPVRNYLITTSPILNSNTIDIYSFSKLDKIFVARNKTSDSWFSNTDDVVVNCEHDHAMQNLPGQYIQSTQI